MQHAASEEHEDRVFNATKAFREAAVAGPREIAHAVSHAAYQLSLFSRLRLSERGRAELHMAIFSAAETACRHLPETYSRVQVRRGFRAFAELADLWAGVPLTADRSADAHATARMFRNDCHNMSLAEEIAQRAHRRREGVIVRLAGGGRA